MENGKKMDMQAQTAPDAPKKNAAIPETPKSLGATIQNVISKAVTKSPTDGKIDFAQGVNHITGNDPQQKVQDYAPDAMQSLKDQNDMKQKDETYHEDEKKDVKETEEKEKEDIKSMADKEKNDESTSRHQKNER